MPCFPARRVKTLIALKNRFPYNSSYRGVSCPD